MGYISLITAYSNNRIFDLKAERLTRGQGVSMKMSKHQNDIEILKMMMVIESFMERLKDMTEKQLPIKKERAWDELFSFIQETDIELSQYISEMEESLSANYGDKIIGKASQMAKAEYDKMIVEEQFYRETIQIAGKGIEVLFLIDESDNSKINIISISEPIIPSHLERIKSHLKAKLAIENVSLNFLYPLKINELNKLKNTIVTDLSGAEWIITGSSIINNEAKVSLTRSEVITSEELTRNFTSEGNFIGKWESNECK